MQYQNVGCRALGSNCGPNNDGKIRNQPGRPGYGICVGFSTGTRVKTPNPTKTLNRCAGANCKASGSQYCWTGSTWNYAAGSVQTFTECGGDCCAARSKFLSMHPNISTPAGVPPVSPPSGGGGGGTDADCDSWGVFKGVCVLGKSFQKGVTGVGMSAGAWGQGPLAQFMPVIMVGGGIMLLAILLKGR